MLFEVHVIWLATEALPGTTYNDYIQSQQAITITDVAICVPAAYLTIAISKIVRIDPTVDSNHDGYQ